THAAGQSPALGARLSRMIMNADAGTAALARAIPISASSTSTAPRRYHGRHGRLTACREVETDCRGLQKSSDGGGLSRPSGAPNFPYLSRNPSSKSHLTLLSA